MGGWPGDLSEHGGTINQERDLEAVLRRIDGRGYKAYKDIQGVYDLGRFVLYVDYVQGDPFAAPSRLRVRVPVAGAGLPGDLWSTRVRRVALQDYLTRRFAAAVDDHGRDRRGSGKSGLLAIDRPGQEVLERTAMVVDDKGVEARIVCGLPAAGRRVLGGEARRMLLTALPDLVRAALMRDSIDFEAARRHVELAEDQEAARGQLGSRGLVAFVGDGAVLPRESGISDRPLKGPGVVPFISPPELRTTLTLPNAGEVGGMGIPRGVTLIVGGGYHGKSTLLRAIERGVYNHIAGDGREWAITVPGAVKIRAEDGRRVGGVNISGFISGLPQGQDTACFSTDLASGSTSQAANIVEALEVGAGLLLVDEDTSATNFMIRDARMQRLVAADSEPITPFIDRVRDLYEGLGVSTILVVGGSGDYFDVADTVIRLRAYRPDDATAAARRIAAELPRLRTDEGRETGFAVTERFPLGSSLDPRKGRKVKIAARGPRTLQFGTETIDLGAVEQLCAESQTRAIGDLLHYMAQRYCDGRTGLSRALDRAFADIASRGLDIISPFYGQNPGDYALPRRFEVAAALNRYRRLRVRQSGIRRGDHGRCGGE